MKINKLQLKKIIREEFQKAQLKQLVEGYWEEEEQQRSDQATKDNAISDLRALLKKLGDELEFSMLDDSYMEDMRLESLIDDDPLQDALYQVEDFAGALGAALEHLPGMLDDICTDEYYMSTGRCQHGDVKELMSRLNKVLDSEKL